MLHMDQHPDPGTADLAERARSGDGVALDLLVERYLPRVRAYLRVRAGKMLLDRESVSDLAQSVCRVVLENAERFQYDHEDGFRRWLFKTAERKVMDRYDYYTAQKRTPEQAPRFQESTAEADQIAQVGVPSPSEDASAREELALLERAIDELPEDMHELVILAKIVGLSRAAIAQELGTTEGAVRMRLHRALAQLADNMARSVDRGDR